MASDSPAKIDLTKVWPIAVWVASMVVAGSVAWSTMTNRMDASETRIDRAEQRADRGEAAARALESRVIEMGTDVRWIRQSLESRK